MFKLIRKGIDISTKVNRIITQRYDELRKRQRISSIALTKKDTQVSRDEVKALSEQNALLQTQLDEMKKMMEQMMAMQNKESNNSNSETTTQTKKKPGRPTKVTN